MGNVRLPKPTPLGWVVAGGIAVAAGAITFLLLHSPIVAALIGLLAAAAFVMAGPRPEAQVETAQESSAHAAAAVPAQRTEPAPVPAAAANSVPSFAPPAAPVPAVGVAPPVALAPAIGMAPPALAASIGVAPPVAAAPPATPMSLPADPLDQVSLLSAYLHEETDGYQPSYASEAPSLVARVPGQTLAVTGPDPLATAFATPAEPSAATAQSDGTAWRMGMDILPQSRSTALAVGNRLGSFRSAVVKARREAKPAKPAKQAKPKPPPGKHRAG